MSFYEGKTNSQVNQQPSQLTADLSQVDLMNPRVDPTIVD